MGKTKIWIMCSQCKGKGVKYKRTSFRRKDGKTITRVESEQCGRCNGGGRVWKMI